MTANPAGGLGRVSAPGEMIADGSLGISPILTARFLSRVEIVDLPQSPWDSSGVAAREDLGGTGGFPPPAAELDALGLAAAEPFFTIVASGGGGG